MSDRVIFILKNVTAAIRAAFAVKAENSESSKGPIKVAEPSALFPNVSYSVECKGDGNHGEAVDLQIEAAASTVVGTNIVLHNNPFELVQTTIKNMNVNLKRAGFWSGQREPLNIAAAEMQNAEFTFLYYCDSPEAARELLKTISFRIHAIHGEKAQSVTSCDRETVYANHLPEGMLRVYIKWVGAKDTILEVADEEARSSLVSVAPLLVRIEYVLNGRTIRKGIPSRDGKRTFNRLVSSWQFDKGNAPSGWEQSPAKAVFAFVRKALRLDRPLASEAVAPESLDILKPYTEVLAWYFSGNDPHEHPYFSHLDKVNRSKRFSACKQDIYKAGQFDITIPWEKAKILAVDGLSEHLTFENRFRIAHWLRPHTFTPEGVTKANGKLSALYAGEESDTNVEDGAWEVSRPAEEIDLGEPNRKGPPKPVSATPVFQRTKPGFRVPR